MGLNTSIECSKTKKGMSIRKDIYAAIEHLRSEQEDRDRAIGEWILAIEARLAQAKKACLKGKEEESLYAILEATSLGVACIQQHGVTY